MILCYRYYPWEDVDSELVDIERVWEWVQSRNGDIQIRNDCVDFWLSEAHAIEFCLRWGSMRRHSELDR